MSRWADFPKSFIRRSVENVLWYRGPYETTNLINCCFGLLTLPNGKLQVPNYTFSGDDQSYGISKGNIKVETSDNFRLENILRHIRNGLAHGHIQQICEDNKITRLQIQDKDYPEFVKVNFEIELTLRELQNFALKLADSFLGDEYVAIK